MSTKEKKTSGLTLDGEITLKQVMTLKQTLASALEQDGSILIDASRVECVDSAGIQLLVAFVSQAKKSGQWSGWAEAGEAIPDAAGWLGLAQALHFDSGDPA